MLVVGGLLALAGIVGLIFASAHAPTLGNALSKSYVLKTGSYNALRTLSWLAIGCGVLSAIAGVMRRERALAVRPPAAPGVQPALRQPELPGLTFAPPATGPTAPPETSSGSRGVAILMACVALLFAAAIVGTIVARGHARASAATVPASASAPVDTAEPQPAVAPTQTTAATSPGEQSALDVVAQQGFEPIDVSYVDGDTIHVVIGTSANSGDSGVRRAFFFADDGQYLGTDTSLPSGWIELAYQDADTVALRYTLWNADDAECCANGGSVVVRFRWDGSRLEPLDPIPSASYDASPSRR